MTRSGAEEPDARSAGSEPVQPPTPAGPFPAWPYSSLPGRPTAPPVPGSPVPGSPVRRPPRPGPAEAWRTRPYPQLLRGPGLRWWRPLLSVVLLVAGIAVVLGVTIVIVIVFYLVVDVSGRGGTESGPGAEGWEASPVGLLLTNLLLAVLIPLVMLAVWGGFGWRPRWVSSVVGGVRWGWLTICAGVAAAVLVLPSLALTLLTEDVAGWTPEPQWASLAVVVILTTPLQAAGEEYLFRGWLPQTIGSVFGAPRLSGLVGGLIASLLFAFAHGQQDPWLFADRLAFGMVACWLVWRTGGLEAAIAVHALNNLLVFGFTIAQGRLADSLTVTRARPGEVVLDVVTFGVAAVVLSAVARRRRVIRLFVPPQA